MIRGLWLLAAAPLVSAQVQVVVSSNAGDRLAQKPAVTMSKGRAGGPAIIVDTSKRYQTMTGFGATLNEAGLMVINKLPKAKQEAVLEDMFSARKGAGWTLVKAPLAACDFASAGPFFTYDDVKGDKDLKQFSIQRDLAPNGILTFIKRGRKYGDFRVQGTTDYPPDWMLDARYALKPEYFDTYARYLVKYLQAYAKQGITVDYLAPFNEPQFIYCKISYPQIGTLIKDYLGPQIEKARLKTEIQFCEAHDRETGLQNIPKVLADPGVRKYVRQITVHGYRWEKQTSAPIGKLHDQLPDIPVWQTEVCYAKTIDHREMPVYGFEDGDRWGRMLIADARNWSAGWIYWNAVLDEKGGPWLISLDHHDPDGNSQHPVIIVDTSKGEVTHTGLYYYLAHFSKYVRPGAVRVESTGDVAGLRHVAFQAGDGSRILEVVNSGKQGMDFSIGEGDLRLPAQSIGTFTWR